MKGGKLFARVVPQERDRGYMLLVSWEKPVVQRTAAQLITLGGITRASLDAALEQAKAVHGAGEVEDVTPGGVQGSLKRLFGEVVVRAPKV